MNKEILTKKEYIATQLLAGWLASCTSSSDRITDYKTEHTEVAIKFANELLRQLKNES